MYKEEVEINAHIHSGFPSAFMFVLDITLPDSCMRRVTTTKRSIFDTYDLGLGGDMTTDCMFTKPS